MGTIKAILGIVVIAACVYSGFEIAPVLMANYSFTDDLRQISVMGGVNPHETDQELVDAVVKKAREHDLPLTPEQVTVQRIGTPGAPAVYIAADYTVPVSIPGYSFTLHFSPTSGNKGF